LSFVALSACDWREALRPSGAPGKKEEVEKSAEPTGAGFMSPREKFAFYRWLVTEMQEQIFARPLQDKSSSGGWANVLSQRGSIEGVYHGFVLSSEYFALEKGKPANIKALRFYGVEMALLDYPAALESDSRVQEAAARYVNDNMRSSVFTLKRELGARILKESEKRKKDAEGLAAWYSNFATRWARMDVPFGLERRNLKDEAFHFKWAKENTLGMVQWELLNRQHRILNFLDGIQVPSQPVPAAQQPSRAGK